MSQLRNSKLSLLSVVMLLLGLLVACVYSNNDIVTRMTIPAVFVIPSAILAMVHLLRGGNWGKSGLVLSLCFTVAGYFMLRALLSPVYVFAVKDFMLFSQAALVAFVVSVPENRRLLARWLPWVLVLLVLIQCIPLPWQWGDPNYVPFREPFLSKQGVSGFFGHRNFFAVLMGMCSVGLLCYTFVLDSSRGGLRWLWGAVALLGFGLLYFSQSRGAWVAVAVALFVVLVVFLVWRVLSGVGTAKASILSGVLIFLAGGLGMTILGMSMASKRGFDDERGFFFLNARNDLLRMAFDSEPENVVIGGGARFYEYEARRVTDPDQLSNEGLGDPRVVHNEYIEALVNYGYVGMVCLICLVCACLLISLWQIFDVGTVKVTHEKKRWLAMQLTVLGVLVAIAVQSVVDFSLHVLPITMLFGLAVGVIQMGFAHKIWRYVNSSVAVACVIVLGVVAFPFWRTHAKEEVARGLVSSNALLAAERLVEVGEVTRNYEAFKSAGDIYVAHADRVENVLSAKECYMNAVKECPFDASVVISIAKLAFSEGDFAVAREWMDKANALVGRLHQQYAVGHWNAMVDYGLMRERLMAGEPQGEELVAMIRSLKRMTGMMNKKVVRHSRYAVYVDESKAVYSILLARYAATRASHEGGKGEYALALGYLSEAKKSYDEADRYAAGYKTQGDLQRLVTLRQQRAFLEKYEIEEDPEIRKKLDLELFGE